MVFFLAMKLDCAGTARYADVSTFSRNRRILPSQRSSPAPQPASDAGATPVLRGRGRPRRGEAETLERALLEQALKHFLEKGFEATTINAITDSIGMSKRTVYARYDDKLSLFKAALQRAIDEWLEPLQSLPTVEDDDLETTLVNVARLVVGTLLSPAGLRLIRICNAESYRMPEIGAHLYNRGRQHIAHYLIDLFHRRMCGGGARPADLEDLATAFLNLISGPARLNAWGFEDNTLDVEAFIHSRVRLFLYGARSFPENSKPL